MSYINLNLDNLDSNFINNSISKKTNNENKFDYELTLSLEKKEDLFIKSDKMERLVHLSTEKSFNYNNLRTIKNENESINKDIHKVNTFVSEIDKVNTAPVINSTIPSSTIDKTKEINNLKSITEVTSNTTKTNSLTSILPSEFTNSKASKYKEIITEMSEKYNVPEKLIYQVIKTESNFNEKVVSSAGAQGLMQLMPATAKWLGVKDSFDPKQNIEGGVSYLSKMIKKYDGNLTLAVAAYNAGPGNVDKYGGVPPFKETQNYVKKVLG